MHTSPFMQYNPNMLLLVSLWASLGQKMSCRHLLPPYSQKVCKIRDKKLCLSRRADRFLSWVWNDTSTCTQQEINFPNWGYFVAAKEKTTDGISYIYLFFFHMMGKRRRRGLTEQVERYERMRNTYISIIYMCLW